nr:hypothetical protein [Paludibacterium denitrificans]
MTKPWLPHASFHDFYGDFHAIGEGRPRCKDSLIFSTQSTHKLLAGISQASQILVQDPQNRQLDTAWFNEAYLMHTSTSPQYSIIASCDVAAAMMEQPGGRHWWKNRWWKHWISAAPCARWTKNTATTGGSGLGPGRTVGRWHLRSGRLDAQAGRYRHGFAGIEDGFNMLDPIKATILTPGLDLDGSFRKWVSRRPS